MIEQVSSRRTDGSWAPKPWRRRPRHQRPRRSLVRSAWWRSNRAAPDGLAPTAARPGGAPLGLDRGRGHARHRPRSLLAHEEPRGREIEQLLVRVPQLLIVGGLRRSRRAFAAATTLSAASPGGGRDKSGVCHVGVGIYRRIGVRRRRGAGRPQGDPRQPRQEAREVPEQAPPGRAIRQPPLRSPRGSREGRRGLRAADHAIHPPDCGTGTSGSTPSRGARRQSRGARRARRYAGQPRDPGATRGWRRPRGPPSPSRNRSPRPRTRSRIRRRLPRAGPGPRRSS